MSTAESQNQAGAQGTEQRSDAHLPILGLIDSLQQRCSAETDSAQFVSEVLRGFVALSDACYGAFWRVRQEDRHLVIVKELMPGVTTDGARGWAEVLGQLAVGVIEQTIIRYQTVPEPAGGLITGREYVGLGFPVRGDVEVAGCMTIVVGAGAPILSDAGITMLRLLADMGMHYSAIKAAGRFEESYAALSNSWDVVGEALAFTKPFEMAQVLSDKARSAFKAQRVAVGFVDGESVQVAAVSGEDILDKRSNLVRNLRAAQTEVVVSGEPAFFSNDVDPARRAELTTRHPQHERLVRESGANSVYSVPLRRDDKMVGVWTLEFGAGTPLTDARRQVTDITAGQLGPVLHLARQNSRNPLLRAGDGMGAAVRWVFGKEHPWRKVAGLAIAGVLLFAVFGKADFNISGNCTLGPSSRHVYAAPFDSTIRFAPLRPGDTVAEGETLVEFDRRDLELSLRSARSQLASAESERSNYLANQEIAKATEADARCKALAAEIDLLELRLERAVVVADAPGMIITGDLTQETGRPVRMGEALIEVAPLDVLLLEVELAQGDISFVAGSEEGRFTTKAHPDQSIPFTLSKVRPTPEVRGGASVFIAEASVPNDAHWLRPGMEGAAKITVGRRNVVSVLTRKLVDWVQLHFWW